MVQQMSIGGIDIETLVLHVIGMNDSGQVMLGKRIARREWLHLITTLPPAPGSPSPMGEH